jgi:SAM-dependent methyltransferase
MDDRQQATASHYRRSFEAFRDAWGPVLNALARPIVAEHVPRDVARVLDLGSGTGETGAVLRDHLAGRSALIVQADLLPFMLEEARRRHPDGPCVRVDAARLPFRDAAFDVVVSAFLWHHVREQRRGFTEVLRVLRPGGRFLFLGWGDGEEHGAAFDDWESWLHEAGAPDEDPRAAITWEEELISADILAGVLREAGFRIDAARDLTGAQRWSWEQLLALRTGVGASARRFETLPSAARARLVARARREFPEREAAAFDWRPKLVVVEAIRP